MNSVVTQVLQIVVLLCNMVLKKRQESRTVKVLCVPFMFALIAGKRGEDHEFGRPVGDPV